VPQPLDQRGRQLRELAHVAPDGILLDDRDDLVVGLALVDHQQPPERPCPQQDVCPRDGALAQHANIERIAVALLGAGERRHARPAVRARHEAVQRGRQRRQPLGPIDHQEPGLLVDLVLHAVERRNLYVRVQPIGKSEARGEAVPGVWAVVMNGHGSDLG
jgi:hypothetical protein